MAVVQPLAVLAGDSLWSCSSCKGWLQQVQLRLFEDETSSAQACCLKMKPGQVRMSLVCVILECLVHSAVVCVFISGTRALLSPAHAVAFSPGHNEAEEHTKQWKVMHI